MLKILLGMFVAYSILTCASIAGSYVLNNPKPGSVCEKSAYECMKDEYPKTMLFVEIAETNPVQYTLAKILNKK